MDFFPLLPFSSDHFYTFLTSIVEKFSGKWMISEGRDSSRTRETEGCTHILDKLVSQNKGTASKMKILKELTQVPSTSPLHMATVF